MHLRDGELGGGRVSRRLVFLVIDELVRGIEYKDAHSHA
jgi:hypothetical protein